jgi:hypothetical protein
MLVRAGEAKLGLLLAMLLALAVPAPPQADGAVRAREADAFVDSVGVNVHTAFSDTPYVSEFATVKQRLEELGVRHVRDGLFPERPDQYQRLNELAGTGIGATPIVGSPADGLSGQDDLLTIAGEELDGLDAIEGPNEHSTSGDPDWRANLIAYQEALYEKVKGSLTLSGLPVIGPSIVHGDQAELGDISDSLDYGNIHSYPQGKPPDKLGPFFKSAELNSGAKPIWATETGYHTALAWAGENPPVSEQAMATYVPRLFLEYFRWGVVRTFSYELLDEFSDPPLEEKESNFGLLRHDLSRKPAFDALRNTIEILEDPGPPFAPDSLDYTLSEAGVELPGPESTGLHKVLLQKRDGSFYLALWRLSSVWDPLAQAPLAAPLEPVEVEVGPGLEAAAEYRPNSSAEPVWSLARPSGPLTVEVGPDVVILQLVPGPPDSGEQPPPWAPPKDTDPSVSPETGARHCVVPRLRGQKLKASRVKLRRAHCQVGRIAGGSGRASRVVGQRPRPHRVLAPGSRVSITLGSDRG